MRPPVNRNGAAQHGIVANQAKFHPQGSTRERSVGGAAEGAEVNPSTVGDLFRADGAGRQPGIHARALRGIGCKAGGGQRSEGKSLETARGAGEMEVVVQPVRTTDHTVRAGRVHKERVGGKAVRVVAGGFAPFEHVVLVAQPRAEGRSIGGNNVVIVTFHETGRVAVHVRVAHEGVATRTGGPDDIVAVRDVDRVADVDPVAAVAGVVLDQSLLALPIVG